MQDKIVGWMGTDMNGAAIAYFKVLSRNLPQMDLGISQKLSKSPTRGAIYIYIYH
jgi:hypothetical protein